MKTNEGFDLCLKTPAGEVTAHVEVPAGFVPITAIVPLMQRLGEQAMALEEREATEIGKTISCRMGCAACCRMLVPVSAPEAFVLRDMLAGLAADRRETLLRRVEETERHLREAGLLDRLMAVAESERQLTDADMESINHDYYALRLPCPFLEHETCSIYEHRPAACRELLVTTPAELCGDIERNPVRPLPVPMRISTALGQLWADLTMGPNRLIPLPVAWSWAQRHVSAAGRTWKGMDLLEQALDKIWRYLSREFAARNNAHDLLNEKERS